MEHHPQEVPLATLQTSTPSNHYFAFCHYRLILSVLEFYLKRSIKCTFFVLASLTQHTVFDIYEAVCISCLFLFYYIYIYILVYPLTY